jgi:protein SCO1/2
MSRWSLVRIASVAAVAVVLGFLTFRVLTMPTTNGPAIGGPFALQDGNGKTVTDRDLRGKWLLIYFGYTHCPDACPTTLSQMAAALDKLGDKKDRIVPVFITVDPDRDTPATMKDYAASFGPNFVGLSGSPDAVKAVEREYHVYAAKHPIEGGDYEMDHSSVIYLMDPDGKFVTNYVTGDKPEDMAKSLNETVS